ncbi:hypothetical protein BMS3Abin02_02243 [bacterium BMS3Abin02]|nr:hypothetical protein BMS3Abin02_02243 [bacterium BMS3Abin02]GBE21780.1 hypothetical protein BMS3Bbin01_01132 [bacterium BMS3Bbin01]HDH27414.1 hypothetical protein [Actinomycetota bacterium]
MGIDRDLLEAVRELDTHELQRLVILARARLESVGAITPGSDVNVSLRQQWIRCGKQSCSRCPHGPYWYAYWTENGQRCTRYVGKLPEEPAKLG